MSVTQAQFIPSPLFIESYRYFVAKYPKIKKRFEEVFVPYKEQRPPQTLPTSFCDHKLSGRLAGLRECHLEADACLIYSDKNGVVKLIIVCDHNEFGRWQRKGFGQKNSGLSSLRTFLGYSLRIKQLFYHHEFKKATNPPPRLIRAFPGFVVIVRIRIFRIIELTE